MTIGLSRVERTAGSVAAGAVAALGATYLVVLAGGLASLARADQPIQDPWFTAMELLILAMCPALIVLAAAVAGIAPCGRRLFGWIGLACMSATVTITACVHAAILVLRDPLVAADPALARVLFAFEWPSVAYVLDVLAWDLFFGCAALALAAALPEDAAWRTVRRLLGASGALALAGLAGVPLADMRVRNVGIIGYAVVFPVASLFLARLLCRVGSSSTPCPRCRSSPAAPGCGSPPASPP